MRPPILHLQEAPPEVIAAMVDEADWDFDILKLEKASNHRWVSVQPNWLKGAYSIATYTVLVVNLLIY